jgi:acrosin
MDMRLLGSDPAATLPGPAREITVEPIQVPREAPHPEPLPEREPEPQPVPEREREPEKVPA